MARQQCARFSNNGGGGLALFVLLALSLAFAGCNLDGDSGSGSSDTFVHNDEDSPNDEGYTVASDGTWHVYTAEGLKAWNEVAVKDTSLSCTLHNCINMSELEDFDWTPVGENSSDMYYTGTFAGNGHTISNLVVELSDSYVGFFGYIRYGTVTRLTLENPTISGTSYVGGIAGYNYGGTIENCVVSGGTISGSARDVGGIVGYNDFGTVTDCENSSTVSGEGDYVGGIVGCINTYYTIVTGCTNNGTVTGSGSNVGHKTGNG